MPSAFLSVKRNNINPILMLWIINCKNLKNFIVV